MEALGQIIFREGRRGDGAGSWEHVEAVPTMSHLSQMDIGSLIVADDLGWRTDSPLGTYYSYVDTIHPPYVHRMAIWSNMPFTFFYCRLPSLNMTGPMLQLLSEAVKTRNLHIRKCWMCLHCPTE